MTKKISLIVVVLAAAAGGMFFFRTRPPVREQPKAITNESGMNVPADAVVVEMLDDQFFPSEVTVKKDQTVYFLNKGAEDHWPASDIHPTHGIYPEFDPKRPVAPGAWWSFKFYKAGIWRMHDHLFPQITGKVTVQEK